MKARLTLTLTAAAVAAALISITPVSADNGYANNIEQFKAFKKSFQRRNQCTFKRIATSPVFENTGIATATATEIVAASSDSNTLIYTDSENNNVGFVDITGPSNPTPFGCLLT